MSVLPMWLEAFPIQPATRAVDIICEAWNELTEKRLQAFNETTREANLTKTLKIYVDDVVSRRHGFLGMWSSEDIIGIVDPSTGAITEERRTDIVYGWNSSTISMRLVFEFKKLSRKKRDRDHYLMDSGLGRFVKGVYARDQQVATMVGILLDPEMEVVPPLQEELANGTHAIRLRMRAYPCGSFVQCPSVTFQSATFDTEHDRIPEYEEMGAIRVSHIFLSFGYSVSASI